MKILSICRCFVLAVTWFVEFFQIVKKHPKLAAGRHDFADFHVNRSGDSLEIRMRAKEKKSKSTEEHHSEY
jgi:hypothetical protein